MTAPAIDLLDALERRWRGPLREASLVAEVGAMPDDVRTSLRALGWLYQKAWDEQAARDLLHRRFPACVVVALSGIGALDYVHGNYWTGVWQQAGVTPRPGDQACWGRAFRSGLDRFRLARFEGLPQVNVGEIMLHAGVRGSECRGTKSPVDGFRPGQWGRSWVAPGGAVTPEVRVCAAAAALLVHDFHEPDPLVLSLHIETLLARRLGGLRWRR